MSVLNMEEVWSVEWEENQERKKSHSGWCQRRQWGSSKEDMDNVTNGSKYLLAWARLRHL